MYYFPFSNQYIANNKIIDQGPRNNYIFSINSDTEFRLKKYNYGENFDILIKKKKVFIQVMLQIHLLLMIVILDAKDFGIKAFVMKV